MRKGGGWDERVLLRFRLPRTVGKECALSGKLDTLLERAYPLDVRLCLLSSFAFRLVGNDANGDEDDDGLPHGSSLDKGVLVRSALAVTVRSKK